MLNFQLNQIITKPTSITQNSTTFIDHVWPERPDIFTYMMSYLLYTVITLLYMPLERVRKKSEGTFQYLNVRSYKKFNTNLFIYDLKQAE